MVEFAFRPVKDTFIRDSLGRQIILCIDPDMVRKERNDDLIRSCHFFRRIKYDTVSQSSSLSAGSRGDACRFRSAKERSVLQEVL